MSPKRSTLLGGLALLAIACGQAAGGQVSTIAGTGEAGFRDGAGEDAAFNLPGALVVDDDGTAYIADTFNHSIRRVTPEGDVTTLAGDGSMGFADGAGPAARFNVVAGIALDRDARVLYVADSQNHLIRQVDLATSVVTTLAGVPHEPGLADGSLADARFNLPYHLALDPVASLLWVVDKQNNAIRIIDLTTRSVRTIAGGGEPGFADGVGAAASFSAPSGITIDGAGGAFVADSPNRVLRHVGADGSVGTVAGVPARPGYMNGPASVARMAFPWGLATLPDGSVVFADRFNGAVRRLTFNVVTTVAGAPWSGSSLGEAPPRADGSASSAVLWLPTAVALGPGGAVYVTDASSLRIIRDWQ